MKKILLIALSFLLLFLPVMVKAQSFSVQADTVRVNAATGASTHVTDTIITTSSVALKWRVYATTFPADWLVDTVFQICDANLCRQNNFSGQLWNGTSGTTFDCTYPNSLSNSHDFHLQLDLTHVTSVGSFLVTVRVDDPATSYSRTMTFIINKFPTAVSNINTQENNIILYPNPARDELNVVYSANADVKNIAVYNIIGKVMAVYKVTGASANLNLENIPSGIYFVRLTNSHGDVVVTRKFTKQ